MSPQPVLDIAEVAKKTGLPASTLRYYEERGLIQAVGRRGLRRLFAATVLQRLALISLGRSANLSLQEIGAMLTPSGLQIDRAFLAAKADEIDKKIETLQAIRDGLRNAANCPAPNHLECPKFQQLLRAASRPKRRA